MSFILDALKKSENERQRQLGPSLADIPKRRPNSERPWWIFAVAGLLVVNLAVLTIVLVRNSGDADAKPVASATTTAPIPSPQELQPANVLPNPHATAAPRPSPAPTPGTAVRPLAGEAASTRTFAEFDGGSVDLSAAANVPGGPPIVRPLEAPAVAPLPPMPATQPAAANAPAPNNEMLPTHNSLLSSGTSLPDLRLDIHVYSPQPAERFVFVNMRKYSEGQSLSEGPTVERITLEGVVLNNQGLRFLLPK